MKVEWRKVDEAPGYEVSNDGRVRSYWSGGSKPYIADTVQNESLTVSFGYFGYADVKLQIGGKQRGRRIHRLVAAAFIGDVAGKDVHHRNGVRSDNRVSNLEIVSTAQNMRHTISRRKPLTNAQVAEIRRRRSQGETVMSLAHEFNLSHTCISSMCIGKSYRDAGGPLTKGQIRHGCKKRA